MLAHIWPALSQEGYLVPIWTFWKVTENFAQRLVLAKLGHSRSPSPILRKRVEFPQLKRADDFASLDLIHLTKTVWGCI